MTALTVEHLSKRYQKESTSGFRPTSFRELISQSIRGALSRNRKVVVKAPEDFWALKDVSFSLAEGTRLGVIGGNGAGKSTLLKILSRITEPTEGRIQIFGRTASLLEIGTGFHPELTGRENIFLNGTLLGMGRDEVRRKLDQIVDFAEIGAFLDEPVKHYSSGMYVRLGFSIAAHVDPDILILDEVLAVGDVQFQRKCFGKMEELGKAARSVILVSHDLAAVSSLCDRCIILDRGRIAFDGTAGEAVVRYYRSTLENVGSRVFADEGRRVGDNDAVLLEVETKRETGEAAVEVDIGEPLRVAMRYRLLRELGVPAVPNFHFFRPDGVCAFNAQAPGVQAVSAGDYLAEVTIPGHLLNEGAYAIGFALTSYHKSHHTVHFFERNAVIVNVRDARDDQSLRYGYTGEFLGVIRPRFPWKISKL